MHRLGREVRFSVSPFLPRDEQGFNSYCSKPAGRDVAVYFALMVELKGRVEPATGLLVNVTEIDRCVRGHIVPLFAQMVRQKYRERQHISLADLAALLRRSGRLLNRELAPARVAAVSLKLSPFRKITFCAEDSRVFCFSEKFEFAAAHKLWNERFSAKKNFDIFGKCANPAGHGHNYIVEVTVRPASAARFKVAEFQRRVGEHFIRLVDHKNLNAEVERFRTVLPTVENIAAFAWDKLAAHLGRTLYSITVWETDRTCCCYYGGDRRTKRAGKTVRPAGKTSHRKRR
jgi:6-pyruvoyltetrahydropterin/6-carboxytetrahydropterin synthase